MQITLLKTSRTDCDFLCHQHSWNTAFGFPVPPGQRVQLWKETQLGPGGLSLGRKPGTALLSCWAHAVDAAWRVLGALVPAGPAPAVGSGSLTSSAEMGPTATEGQWSKSCLCWTQTSVGQAGSLYSRTMASPWGPCTAQGIDRRGEGKEVGRHRLQRTPFRKFFLGLPFGPSPAVGPEFRVGSKGPCPALRGVHRDTTEIGPQGDRHISPALAVRVCPSP